jgi:hypothetical protein
MTLRFTIDDESFTASAFCFQPFRRLLSEQACNLIKQRSAFGGVWLEFVDIRSTDATFPNAIPNQKRRARRVVTTFAYDGLNRVTQVNYNTVSGVTTEPTVSNVYDSDPTYGATGDGMLLRGYFLSIDHGRDGRQCGKELGPYSALC